MQNNDEYLEENNIDNDNSEHNINNDRDEAPEDIEFLSRIIQMNRENGYENTANTEEKVSRLLDETQRKKKKRLSESMQLIDNVINNLEPNPDNLNNDINTNIRRNNMRLKSIHSTEEYLNNAKELMDAIKRNLDSTLIKDLPPSYTQNISGNLAKDDLAVLLNTENASGNNYLYLSTIRNKILGKSEVSKEEYLDILNRFARIHELHETCKFDPNDPKNKEAYYAQNEATALVLHILNQRGFDMTDLLDLKPNDEKIEIWASAISQKNKLEIISDYLEENPISDDVLSNTEKAIKLIFHCGNKKFLSKEQQEAYDFKYNPEASTLKDVDPEILKSAEAIMNGNSINLTNLREAFDLLHKLSIQEEKYTKYAAGDRNLNNLKKSVLYVEDFLTKKGLSTLQIDTLTKLAGKEGQENPEFDAYAEKILVPLEMGNMARIPVNEAVDKFYSELAVAFDAANNKYGLDLNQDIYVNAAKTFKKMIDFQTALHEFKSQKGLTEMNRHIAKVEKFLELKGFTKKELEDIRKPGIFDEDENGLDGFQKLATKHWDMYTDLAKNDIHEEKEEVIINDINQDITPRKQITVDIGQKTASIEDKEPFDLSKEPVKEKTNQKEYDEDYDEYDEEYEDGYYYAQDGYYYY